jgi:hypothetical protein
MVINDYNGPKGLETLWLNETVLNRLGFVLQKSVQKRPDGTVSVFAWRVLFPLWWLTVASSILPARWLWIHVRKHRRCPGVCQICGYDLRATPDKCPECGEARSLTGLQTGAETGTSRTSMILLAPPGAAA